MPSFMVTIVTILLVTSFTAAAEELLPAPEVGEDGLWTEDWIVHTSGDLRRDLEIASRQGKILALFWEEKNCQYCAALHLGPLRRPDLRSFFDHSFYAVRFKVSGGIKLVGLDGNIYTERELALQHNVLGTPTIEFRLSDGREVFRLPGSAGPEILLAAFEYVTLGGYLSMSFARWMEERGIL